MLSSTSLGHPAYSWPDHHDKRPSNPMQEGQLRGTRSPPPRVPWPGQHQDRAQFGSDTTLFLPSVALGPSSSSMIGQPRPDERDSPSRPRIQKKCMKILIQNLGTDHWFGAFLQGLWPSQRLLGFSDISQNASGWTTIFMVRSPKELGSLEHPELAARLVIILERHPAVCEV